MTLSSALTQQLPKVVVVLSTAISLTGCADRSDLVRRAVELSGPAAVDCGDVLATSDPTSALACAAREVEAGGPFRLVLDEVGIDSQVVHALVRTPEGKLIQIWFDSDLSGGHRWLPDSLLSEKPCGSVRFSMTRLGRGTFSCDLPHV